MEFKLPIQYISHETVLPHVMADLELVASEETPVYNKLFLPKTPESIKTAHQWAHYYTTNKTFLKESKILFKSAPQSCSISDFMHYWNAIQDNKEFKMTYQYIESPWLHKLNTSSSFLMFISLYFITSPLLFLASPIIMMIIPFAILKLKGESITWETYNMNLKVLLSKHALGGLFTRFKDAETNERMYLIGTALFFCIQLYTNVYAFYTFYKNMSHIYKVFETTNQYLTNTISTMNKIQDIVDPLTTYSSFSEDLEYHKNILILFQEKTTQIKKSIQCFGTARAVFYELFANDKLKESLQYSFGFHGFVQNIYQLKHRLGKSINPCTFSDKTTFNRAYYPCKSPVKNTYTLDKNIMITGPNASGKTTLLKTTLINVLLSQQMGCGFYKSATICPYESIYCYINIPDTSGRDSLFQAEARRCKDIVDEVSKNKRTLCIFDELFSGTNPQEATASATALLQFLSSYTSFRFLLTTHFLSVCEQLKTNPTIQMKHMKMNGDKYTYKLTPGISYVQGGVKVLEQLQFPSEIINNARMRSK
jgi:hypothetical protein